MAHKTEYLDFEVHLLDPDRVAELQANPPGETSLKGTERAIIRAPDGAAVEFGNSDNGGVALEFCTFIGMPPFVVTPPAAPNPGHTDGQPPPTGITPYIYSAWFTAGNPDWSKNFPTDVATFTRKSGGWFGIPALFGTTTRFYWRGTFIYDAPQTQDGTPTGTAATAISERIWIDPYFANGGGTPAAPATVEREYDLSRDASPNVDGLGMAMRGPNPAGIRQHSPTDYTGGGGSTDNLVWERLYVRWRKAGTAPVRFWGAWNSAGANIHVELAVTPTGQISLTGFDNASTPTLIGTAGQLALDVWRRLDVVTRQGVNDGGGNPTGGKVWLFLDGVQLLTAGFAAGVGTQAIGFLTRSEIGTTVTGYTAELDLGFWMGARINFATVGLLKEPIFTGTDFLAGSRAVVVRPMGFGPGNSVNWTGDWRAAGGILPRTLNTQTDKLVCTTALARLEFQTDALRALGGLKGAQGVVGAVITHHGYRGTNNGTLGYKLNGGADVTRIMGAPDFTSSEGANNNARNWISMMYHPTPGATPVEVTAFLLIRTKGNDAVESGTDHLSAVFEVIGTFHLEDYPPSLNPALRDPLPFLGCHNSPYPRTPWAQSSAAPISPVSIACGTYTGNGTGQDLTFRSPVNFLWIHKYSNPGFSPHGVRWFSSMLGASLGGEKTPKPWRVPIIEIDPAFTFSATDNPPTGVGAVPDRSAQVAVIANANLALLDGDQDHKRDLLGIIIRTLNTDNPGDGNNWGFLKKTDQGDFIPSDIIVWNPSREHFDVLTDTGPTWIADGVLTNPAWIWLQANDEGQQEQQTIIRIQGVDEEINKAAETYCYLAISDPGMRFMLNGAMVHGDANLPVVHSTIHPNFLPGAAFYFDERPGVDINDEMGFKGPGHAAASVTKLSAAGSTLTPALTFALGTLTLNTALGFGTDTHLAYNLWRNDDGSDDPGKSQVVQYGTYVGDGNATRTITLTPASTKRPLWAMFVGEGQEGILRHPFHLTNNSSRMTGLQLATGLTAGNIDEVTVGISLNTNTVRYHWIVFPGSSVAGNGGWSPPGIFDPVDPESPTGGPWGPDPEPPEEPEEGDDPGSDPPGDPGGGPDDVDKDLDTLCIPFTQRVFNQALTRIGISKRIANALTDNTEPADVMRGAYAQAIRETLVAFPWPFATRWTRLTLITGSVAAPANRDWTYSYEQPADCVWERRIVVVREGAVDPEPPPFQLSFDNTLRINRILTNEPNATLEYTARPECSAGQGDPLFIKALIWKLASKGAGPLTRVADVVKICEDAFAACIEEARIVIRPGNPGPRVTSVDPTGLDISTGSAEANVAAVNRALLRIGANTIANLGTEQSREAEAARLIFEEELVSVLRDYPWAFCTEYTTPALIAGTATVPVNEDWQYSYRLPSNLVALRRITTGLKRLFDPNPTMWRLGTDLTGRLLWTDEIDPIIEYTQRLPDCVLRADPLFRDAFGWRLAAALAPSLAQVDPEGVEQRGRGPLDRPKERKAVEAQLRERATAFAWRQYYIALEKARRADANEQQQDPNTGDAPWIVGR